MRTLRIALIGIANTGKSTLINALSKHFVGAVSAKPQTTQEVIMAIIKKDDMQIVFYDTPGISNSGLKSVQDINKIAKATIRQVDYCVFMFAVDKKVTADIIALSMYVPNKIAVINKTDISSALPIVDEIKEMEAQHLDGLSDEEMNHLKRLYGDKEIGFTDIYPISCRKAKLEYFTSALFKLCEEYGYEQEEYKVITNRSYTDIFNDATREVIFEKFHEELPYISRVEIEEVKDAKDGIIIYQTVFTTKSAKKIFVSDIKEFSMAAKKKMQRIVRNMSQFPEETTVHLYIKVSEEKSDPSQQH